MNLADQLAKQPKTAEELAQATGAAAPSLHRLIRTLASLGLFTEDSEHRFTLTRLGEALQTGTPGSARASVLTLAGEIFTEALDHLLYSVQTGKTGFEKAFGVSLFDWLASHPAEASMFSETMVGLHGTEPPAVAAPTTFPNLKRSSMWAARLVTCSALFSAATQSRVAYCLICHMLLPTPQS
jgi:hypothetical protein